MAHLIQVLLPLYDNRHQLLPMALHSEVQQELTQKFGGMTAYTQSPAEGRWRQAER